MSTDTEPPATDLDQPLRLHPLVFQADGDEVTIGRPDTDSYGVFPLDGAELVRRLVAGDTPRQAAEWYEREYGERLDIVDVVGALAELDLLLGNTEIVAPPPIRWQRLGRALFSPLAWVCYSLITAWAVWAMVTNGDLVPNYRQMFFVESFSIVELTLFLGQFPALLAHEAFHALAGRRIGVRSRLGVSRRLYFLVFETSMDGLVAVPRRRRYLPMLAGMLFDVVWFSGLTLVAHHTREPDGSLSFTGALCLAFAFTTLLRLAWQFYFYLRTDLYAVISTVLGCVDLQRASTRVLANRVDRVLGRPRRHDEGALHPVDRRVARWYSWLLLVGYAAMIVTLVAAVVPVTITFLSGVLGRFVADDVPGVLLLDSAVFVGLNVLQFGLVGWLALRDRARRATEPARHLVD